MRCTLTVLWCALAGCLGLAACGASGSSLDAGDNASTTAASSPSRSSTTTKTVAAAGFSTSPVSTPPTTRGLLSTVSATNASGVDRVTFEFEGPLPGYRIGYTDRPIVQDGSGEEITIDGDSVLLVSFEPASGFDLETPEGRQVYRGPERLDLATSTVTEVARVGDFEAVLQWAIGLKSKVAFRVSTETNPNRVIVEVRSADD